ncbi:MAG TPA: potassium-transporting ATPase subunit KdpB [Bacteroidota bacterium]|nr:potassium-transporting ATPase subunit KdpB [Bacteroidota bacterium]
MSTVAAEREAVQKPGIKTGKPKPPRRMRRTALFTKETTLPAIQQAFVMLRPDIQWKNPVMFVVEVGALLTLLYIITGLFGASTSLVSRSYFIALDIWLFLTVVFANFATALAEARGKAQADSLRRTRRETRAFRLGPDDTIEDVSSTQLAAGDRVVVSAGQTVPGDGEIIEGIASIDESAITGESAPVIRESGGDRSGVTGGTFVLSDRIVVRITSGAGESFLDRMIGLVEGAIRQRSPNEIALTLALSAMTLIFLIVVIPLWPMAWNAEQYMTTYLGIQEPLKSLGTDVPTLIALLVCLIPTTIGALLAAIGIAGMERALRANILAKSGKAVEMAGDIDVVLLDKTGTITMGHRHATKFLPVGKYTVNELGRLASLASAADTTPEGKSILKLYEEGGNEAQSAPTKAAFIAFSAQTRMSGIDLPDGRRIRKGAPDAITKFVRAQNGKIPDGLRPLVDGAASKGATPLVVAEDDQVAGVIVLEDILKPAMKQRFARLRQMGLRTVMITGDNPLTASTIAAEAGVDDFIAEATPESKLEYIRKEQAEGKLVAMMGDGTNDAPALAQADVALAMNAGTQAAKEAANMVDLDSDPTKLIETVEIGKQLLITRGALTTFSIANDVAKYFAIIPALFAGTLPWLKMMDIMNLHSPTSAILSAVIFNALIIPALIPVALKGVEYKPLGADALLRRNLLIWGAGGVVLPFLGIKLIDVVLVALHLLS